MEKSFIFIVKFNFCCCSYCIFSYGISQLRSPQRQPANKCITSFSALQERAKQYFNDTNASENISQMLQLIEDFCREGDKLIEEEKETIKDLQEQVIHNIHET